MENVYGKVDRFYKDDVSSWAVITQETTERYLRQLAWKGHNDSELTQIWSVLRNLLLYADHMKLFKLDLFMVEDYQDIIYEYVYGSEKSTSYQDYVAKFFRILGNFYALNSELVSRTALSIFNKAKESFYEDGKFVPPAINLHGEFKPSDEEIAEVDDTFIEEMDKKMEKLLVRMQKHFHRPRYAEDVDRALKLFFNHQGSAENRNDIILGNEFWDYFFFNYHLIANDKLPVQQYIEDMGSEISAQDRFMLKWSMRTPYNVLFVEEMHYDSLVCRDLLTDEEVEFTGRYSFSIDPFKMLICGHRHRGLGDYELGGMSCIPAAPAQQKRIKDDIMHQLEAFKVQEPSATIEAYLARHVGAVRQNIELISRGRLLRVPGYDFAEPSLCINEEQMPPYDLVELFNEKMRNFGVSYHGCKLAGRLYSDAYGYARSVDADYSDDEIMNASLLLYLLTNDIDGQDSRLFEELNIDYSRMPNLVNLLADGIDWQYYDPRYLSEEGFVNSLYNV